MKRVLFVGIALLSSIFSSRVAAQLVPRMVLIEEGTNWSCPPCAEANPGIDSFITRHQDNVIHLAYHPNWPGSNDPMFLNDQNDNLDRVVNYYGISGVPNLVFDGITSFVPGAGMQGYYEGLWGGAIDSLSRIALTITRSVSGTTVNVHVVAKAVGALSGYKSLYLRVAAVESRVNVTGPNGEHYYDNPMRTMLPNSQGTAITLANGETKTFDFSYPILAAYKASNMYEVAFVQTDAASHEVLQAATSKVLTQQLQPTAGTHIAGRTQEQASLGFTLANNSANDATYKVRFAPNSYRPWMVELSANGTTANPLTVTVPAGQQIAISLTTGSNLSGYTSGILSAVNQTTATSSLLPVKMIAPGTKLAFLDLFGDSVTALQTEITLANLGEPYVKIFGGLEADELGAWTPMEYPEVITGVGKWIVTGTDKSGVKAYLDAGGHMLLNGGEIAFGLADAQSSTTNDVSFLSSTLHATYVKDSAGPQVVHGVSGDVVSGGFVTPFNIYANSAAIGEVNQPDEIKPDAQATPIFYYGTQSTQVAGLRYNDTATNEKLIYTSFGLENLSNAEEGSIVASALKWFRASASVSDQSASHFALEQNYPNPAPPTTYIDYALDQSGPVSITLLDMKGSVVREVVDAVQSAGKHQVALSTSGLANGTYFYILRSGGRSLMHAMTIVK